jgi:hypothetical protein
MSGVAGTTALEEIRASLTGIHSGKIAAEQIGQIERLLANCWHHLRGSGEGGMEASKLLGRTEEMEWTPPMLSFAIERHGATVNGSTRAEVQHWRVDLGSGTAALAYTGRRQLKPMDTRLDVRSVAAEIAACISAGSQEDHRLRWRGADYVRVMTGDVISVTNKQTTARRRRRFALELERLLTADGWRRRPRGSQLVFERNGTVQATPPLA